MQHLNKQNNYLAVGPRGNQKQSSWKSKIYSKNRQLTSKTEDIYWREGGEYIRKITQRTDTKYSNFSEFPHPPKEKQVKLKQLKGNTLSKIRSRTVKRKNKITSKFGMKKTSAQKNNNLRYYNIVTDLQKKPQENNKKLCWDFWNSEIVGSHAAHSEASHFAISKFGRTNTGSIISEEDSSKHGNIMDEKNNDSIEKKINSKNIFHHSRYTKTEASRTDTKSFKQTHSREHSISSNKSGQFSKKRSLPRQIFSNSISSQ